MEPGGDANKRGERNPHGKRIRHPEIKCLAMQARLCQTTKLVRLAGTDLDRIFNRRNSFDPPRSLFGSEMKTFRVLVANWHLELDFIQKPHDDFAETSAALG